MACLLPFDPRKSHVEILQFVRRWYWCWPIYNSDVNEILSSGLVVLFLTLQRDLPQRWESMLCGQCGMFQGSFPESGSHSFAFYIGSSADRSMISDWFGVALWGSHFVLSRIATSWKFCVDDLQLGTMHTGYYVYPIRGFSHLWIG